MSCSATAEGTYGHYSLLYCLPELILFGYCEMLDLGLFDSGFHHIRLIEPIEKRRLHMEPPLPLIIN